MVAAASMMMLFAACQKDEGFDGGVSEQTFTVTVPGQENLSRAAGDGASINRCVLQVYRDGAVYGEQQIATVTGGQATFNLRLVADQTYDFVFWADCADGEVSKHYNTDDLTAITVKGAYTGNNEEFDAFFKTIEDFEVTASFSENVTLKRPFGQLNVITTDLAEIPDADLKPTAVTVSFTALPTTFNAFTGEVSGEAAVEYTADIVDAATGAISVDYIWATEEEASLADFTMTFLNGTTEINTNDAFTSIPIRRNYQTNVSGNLLTKAGEFTVTIDPIFEEPAINDYPELRAAFAEGGKVVLNENVALDAPLVLTGDKTVDIDLNGHDIINNVSVPDATAPQCGNTTVFEVNGGATLNIRGEGKVHAISNEPGEDGYRMAVYAYGNSVVNIYGGDFMNDQDVNAQLDLIYADQEAVINIYGGRFESKCYNSRGYWVLNLKDNSEAQINVYGGTFINFDPSNSMTENPVKNFVVPTSTTVKVSDEPSPNGTYEVVPAGEQVSVPVKVSTPERLVEALANPAVAQVEVLSDIDLSTATTENLTFAEHKTINIAEGATIQLGNANWLTAEKGITLTGEGTIDNTSADNSDLGSGYQKSLIHVMGGECVIDGVTLINDPAYHWHGNANNSAAIAYWNDANVTIRNARVISGEFTICGMGRDVASGVVTLEDSYFESTSSNKDNGQHWAYAMLLYGSKIRIINCEVKGVQGGVSIETCQDAEISGGKYYTVNTEGNKDAFYPVYITNGAVVTIIGGEFVGANDWSGELADGTSAVVSGDNDVNLPEGSIILKGGKFSGKAYNHVTKMIYEPAEGYEYQAIEDGSELKWEVVPLGN